MQKLFISLAFLSLPLAAMPVPTDCCKSGKTPCCSEQCCKTSDNCCKGSGHNDCAKKCKDEPVTHK